jgi:hypothetical protein
MIRLSWALARSGGTGGGTSGPYAVRAATVSAAAEAAGLVLDRCIAAELNGDQVTQDGETALVPGDTVVFRSADA